MKNKDFLKKLKGLNFPEIETPHHKAKLKLALQNHKHFERAKAHYSDAIISSWLKRLVRNFSFLIRNLKTMSPLKKFVAVGVMAVLVLTVVFMQPHYSPVEMVDAKAVVAQAMEKLTHQTQVSKDLEPTLKVLEEALKSNQLKYLGEEEEMLLDDTGKFKAKKIKKLSFMNDDLSHELIITIDPEGTSKSAVRFEIPRDIAATYLTVEIKDGKILAPEKLHAALEDKNLQEQWLKSFIREENEKRFNLHESSSGRMATEISSNQTVSEKTEITERLEDEREALALLKPLLIDANVLLVDISFGTSEDPQTTKVYVAVYTLAGQNEKLQEAQKVIQDTIDQLKTFNSDEARMKIKVLEKALNSKRLTYHPGYVDEKNADGNGSKMLTFLYGETGETVTMWTDPESTTEELVSFTFKSEMVGVASNKKGKWLEVKMGDDEIENFESLRAKLTSYPMPQDEVLSYLIRKDNQRQAGYILKYPEYSKADGVKFTPKMIQQLTELFNQSNVFIIDQRRLTDDQGKPTYFGLGLYPIDDQRKDHQEQSAKSLLESTIKKITVSPENQPKLALLEKAQAATDLTYAGEEMRDGMKYKELSFTDIESKQKMSILVDVNGGISLAK